MPKVKETAADVAKAIAELRSEATSDATRTALGKAGDLMTEFASVDQRARDYLKSGQQLMASDVIFTEGNQGAADAAQQLSVARAAEHQAFETAEAGLRRQQATALGAGAAVAVLVVALLVLFAPRRSEPGESVETGSLSIAHAAAAPWRFSPDAGTGQRPPRMARRRRRTSRRARQGRCSGPRRSCAPTSAASATSTS